MAEFDAGSFGRVAVLHGGWSAEREVSLDSGAQVLAALLRCGIDAVGVDATPEQVLRLRADGYDRVFVMLHGPGGEDGTTQAALELQGQAYTGSGVAGSALAMDKVRSKRLWQALHLPTPDFVAAGRLEDALEFMQRLEAPVFVKPNTQGSSVGMSRVDRLDDLASAFERAREHDDCVIVERYIAGGEYTAAMVGDQLLPLIRIRVAGSYYDYHAKYRAEDTRYECPAAVDAVTTARWQNIARRACEALGCAGWARADFIVDEAGEPWLLEVNTVPGMTSHSLVPMAARAHGWDFDRLCIEILSRTLAVPS